MLKIEKNLRTSPQAKSENGGNPSYYNSCCQLQCQVFLLPDVFVVTSLAPGGRNPYKIMAASLFLSGLPGAELPDCCSLAIQAAAEPAQALADFQNLPAAWMEAAL